MKNYWFTGDPHFGHSKILTLCNRPFNTIEEHDNSIISNHNSVVLNEDTVFNFGDIGYRCSPFYVVEKIRQLNGKLIVILGNHDKVLRQALQMGLLEKELRDGKIEILGGKCAIEDHTLAISKMLDFNGQKIFIGHYGHRTWPSAFRGTIHLFAHSHSNLPPLYKSFDIGVDTHSETHKRFYPYSLQEIFNIAAKITDEFSEKNEDNHNR